MTGPVLSKKFCSKLDKQYESTKLSHVEHQEKQKDTEKSEIIPADKATVSRFNSPLSAFKAMVASADLTDQQISDKLNIDKAQWSRILHGSAHFPMNKFNDLFNLCGSELFLQYLNYMRGYEHQPRKRKSALERELDAANERAERLNLEVEILTKALRGRTSG